MSLTLVELPEDVFVHLFGYLHTADICHLEQCCSRLSYLATLYWRQIRELRLVTFMRWRGGFDIGNCFIFDVAASGLIRRVGSHLRMLDLSDFGPLEYGIRAGLETAIIEQCTQLHTLIIKKRLFERDWFIRLAAATGPKLKHLTLQSLHVRGFGMLDDGTLSEALVHWQHLETLDMRNNPCLSLNIGLLPATLTQLDCRNNRAIGMNGFTRLFAQCPNLQSFAFTYHNLPGLPFDRLPFLEHLNIDTASTNSHFSAQFADSLSQISTLRSLILRSNFLCDRVLKHLSTNPSLRLLETLRIQGPSVTPESAEKVISVVSRMPKLDHLSMVSCAAPLALAGLASLKNFVKIKTLDLSYSMTFDQVTEEVWAQTTSQSLTSFTWLSHNYRSDSQHFERCKTIEQLLRKNCPRLGDLHITVAQTKVPVRRSRGELLIVKI